jgi:peroxiredoxin
LPQLEDEIWQKYKDDGLVFYSISSSRIGPEDPDQLAAFVAAMGLTMPVLFDSSSETYYDYYINDPDAFSPYPREFVISKEGIIQYASSNVDVPALQAVIEAELAK